MTESATQDLAQLTPAWQELEASTHVKLRKIDSDRHYQAMVALMNKLLDKIGGRESHPLMGLLDVVAFFVQDYEDRNVEMPKVEPAATLRFLMDQHNLRQVDLASLFGTQSNVSEVLNGKRQINVRQARALAKRFGVSVASFV